MKGHNLRARASWAARSMSRRRRAAEHLPSLTARDARTHTTTHVCSPSSASAAGVDTQHKRHPLTRCFCQRGVQHRGAGEHVGLCCTACQQIEHDAHHSERMQAIRMEINSVLMRELPHTVFSYYRMCVLLLQNVFSYYRMCSLTTDAGSGSADV